MISVIIPTLNEEHAIRETLASLGREPGEFEIIVADGGSTDRTNEIVASFPGVRWVASKKGRGGQMNAGAKEAKGDVLLFLHADTVLAHGWHEEATRIAAGSDFALGAFGFCIGQAGRAYRVIEWGVRWRCRLFHLPYGDQALFARTSDFRNEAGFRDMPMMEDVDFVRRMRWRGRVIIAETPAVTSARRWERRGPLRQTGLNWTTYMLYRVGVPLDRLARRYHSPARRIVVFGKYPEPGRVKTRLAASVGDVEAARVYADLFVQTLKTVDAGRDGAETIVQYAPPGSVNAFRRWLGARRTYAAQCDGDLGERMLKAFEESTAAGIQQTILVGTDCPGLTPSLLRRAFAGQRRHDVVVGPATDGGYYLIGASRPHPELFRDIEWSTDTVLEQTIAACAEQGLTVARLECLRDIDTLADLEACAKDLKWKMRRDKD